MTKVSYIKDTCRIAGHLSDDLFQHIWVRLLEFDHAKLEQIYSKGYLQFYIYRMIINEARNPKNPFLKKLRTEVTLNDIGIKYPTEDISVDYDKENDLEFEYKVKVIKEKLNELFWYDKDIFLYYVEFGSLRKVAAQTGIKYGAIHQTVKKVKRIINENINSRR